MSRYYSRLSKIEEKRNIRRAFIYVILTLLLFTLFIFFGIPTIAKFASLLTDIKSSNQPLEKNDNTPPIIPKIEPLPEFTNQKKLQVRGATEPGAKIIMSLNNQEEEILANKNGEFTIDITILNNENYLSFRSKDLSNNESQKTDIITITYDNQPPSLEITSPNDQQKFYGSKQKQIMIEGSTDQNTKIKINERIVIVESDGKFAYLTTLSDGNNSFNIKAEDKAGNTREKQLQLSYTP